MIVSYPTALAEGVGHCRVFDDTGICKKSARSRSTRYDSQTPFAPKVNVDEVTNGSGSACKMDARLRTASPRGPTRRPASSAGPGSAGPDSAGHLFLPDEVLTKSFNESMDIGEANLSMVRGSVELCSL